jgi:CDP-diacylglycerol--glycerol-3-phosphate 3-phosphatidyltransferase
MNLPNALTVSRILLSPVVVVLLLLHTPGGDFAALLVFAVAALTDLFDGRIARSTGDVTQFGRFMDPLADKVLTVSLFVAFVANDIVPVWMVVVIVIREFVITGLRSLAAYRGLVISPSYLAKWKTVVQMTAISLIMLLVNIGNSVRALGIDTRWGDPDVIRTVAVWSVGVCVVLTVVTGFDYLVKFGKPLLRGVF